MFRLMHQEGILPILAKYILRLWKLLRKTPNSARSQQVVAIGYECAPHVDKSAGPPFLLAIHHLFAYIHLERCLPIKDRGLRRPAEKMLSPSKIYRRIKFSEKLSIATGAKTHHFLRRLRFKRQPSGRRRKHEPPVKPMCRRRLVSECQPLL